MDKTAPSYTLQAGGSTISSGSYTNKQIVYSASDDHFSSIKYKKPGSGSYSTYYSGAYTVAATDANNGWWYFYATDTKGQTSSTVSVYLDTVKPVGKVTNASGTTIANGGYTNSAVKYTATDTGGVSKYEVKKPGSSAWTSYTSGTSLSGTNGWYCFRATDKAGNVSDEYEVYYDASVPTGSLYGGTSLKSSGGYTNAQYVKYVASDSGSGIAYCYVRMPGSSVYTAYASGTQLATEGTYYFYCKDHSGNASSAVSITLDKTKPAGTLKKDACQTEKSALSGKLRCPDCGGTFRRQRLRDKIYWQCEKRSSLVTQCRSRRVREDAVCEAFTDMLYKLKAYRKEIVCDLIGKLERLQSDQIQNQGVIGKIDKEIADLSAKNLVMTRLHTSGALNEADYAQRFTEINNRLTELRRERRKQLSYEGDERLTALKELNDILSEYVPSSRFDEELFGQIVEKVIVDDNAKITFCLYGDLCLTETIPEKRRCMHYEEQESSIRLCL